MGKHSRQGTNQRSDNEAGISVADVTDAGSCWHETGQPPNLVSREEKGAFRVRAASITQRGRTPHISKRGHTLDRVSFPSRRVERSVL